MRKICRNTNGQRARSRTASSTIALALVLAAPAALAELRKVDQTVYGMDCAPCAYGVEKGIGKLDGVESVAVSLNDGNAVVELAEGNKVSIADIQQVVSDGGFTPKEAHIEVAGKLVRKDDKRQLVTEDGTRYELTEASGAKDAWAELQDAQDDTQLVLEGVVPADNTAQLEVEKVRQPEPLGRLRHSVAAPVKHFR